MAITRAGNIGNADNWELFFKQFSGEVLAEYEQINVFENKIWSRTISSGKSASFPIINNPSNGPTKFIPGTHTLDNIAQALSQGEKVINIDGLIIAATLVPEIDEWMSEFEVRSKYARKLAYKMATDVDANIAAEMLKNGNLIKMADAAWTDISGQEIADAIATLAQKMDENNVPDVDRYLAMAPAAYYKLFNYLAVIDKDYGARGDIATGSILELYGFKIVKSNTLTPLVLPSSTSVSIGSNYSATNEGGADHTATVSVVTADNDAGVIAVAWVPEAMAMLKLKGLMTETEYDIVRQGTWLVTKMAAGFGALRPEGIYILGGANVSIA